MDDPMTRPSTEEHHLAVHASVALVSLLSILLAACNSTRFGGPTVPATPSVAISITDLPGSWGLASYQTEADKERTSAEAKVACNNPYNIGQGPNGGVMMYLADQNQPSEVFLKLAPNGRTYLGPKGPPGIRPDRLIISFDNDVLVTDWVDPSARQRYGTMVFARCNVPA